jgi:hypothetical protein
VTHRGAHAGLVGAGAAGVVLSAAVSSGRPILASRWWLLEELALWALAWGAGVLAAFRLPARRALPAVIVIGVALRVAALAGPPTTSDDLYRYAWDARVQATGTDPYRYPPVAPQLVGARDGWLWPGARGCSDIHRPVGCTRINRPEQRTIYPPVAEGWFAAVRAVAGDGHRAKTWQAGGLVTELAVLAMLPVALRRYHRDVRWAALYALSPAPVLEAVNNAHVDGLAVALLLGAVVLAAPGRTSPPRDGAVGLLIGAAALVKLYPALVLVAARPRKRVVVPAVALAAVAYAPHLLGVGARVLGYLPGYLREEHYESGGRFLLAGVVHLPGAAVAGVAAATTAAWVLRARPELPVAGAALFGVLLLAVSPVQPWYAVAPLAMATVAARPRWCAIALAGYPYFFAVILASPHASGIGQLAYGSAAAVVAAACVTGVQGGVARPGSTRRRRPGGDPPRPRQPAADRRQVLPPDAPIEVMLSTKDEGAVVGVRRAARRGLWCGANVFPFTLPVA